MHPITPESQTPQGIKAREHRAAVIIACVVVPALFIIVVGPFIMGSDRQDAARRLVKQAEPWVPSNQDEPVVSFVPEYPRLTPVPDALGDPLPRGAFARLGSSRFRQGSSLRHIAWTRDGKILVAADENDGVCGWDADTGVRLWRRQQAGDVRRLAALGEGRVAVSSGHGIQILDVRDGSVASRIISGATRGPHTSHFLLVETPDGTLQATGGSATTFSVWPRNFADEGKEFDLGGNPGSLAFSADGKAIVALREDGVARTWSLPSGERAVQVVLGPAPDQNRPLLLSPDGALAAGFSGGLSVWDVQTGRRLHRSNRSPGTIEFSADGSRLAVLEDSHRLVVREARTGEVVLEREFACWVRCGSLSPNGKRFAGGITGGAIAVWDISTDSPGIAGTNHISQVTSLSFTLDGARLVSASSDQRIVTWDWKRALPLQRWVRSAPVALAAPLGSGRVLVVDSATSLLEAATGKTILTVPGEPLPFWLPSAVLSRNRRRVVVLGRADGAPRGVLRILEAETLATITEIPIPDGQLESVALSPGGETLGVTVNARILMLWNASDGKPVGTLAAPERMSYPSSVVWHPNGVVCLAGGSYESGSHAEGDVRVRLLGGSNTLPGSDPWSHQGEFFASPAWHDAHTVNVRRDDPFWKAHNTFRGLPGRPTALAWSPDGRVLATGGSDGTLLLWDAAAPDSSIHAEDPGSIGPAERASRVRPVVSLAFDGRLDGTGVAPTRLLPDSVAFAKGHRGEALRLVGGPAAREIRIPETDSVELGEAWTVRFRFLVEKTNARPVGLFLRVFECELGQFAMYEGGYAIFYVYSEGRGGHTPLALSDKSSADGIWHHVAVTCSPADQTIRLYVDGAALREVDSGNAAKRIGRLTFGIPKTTGPETTLLLDDFAIDAGALSADQIAREAKR